MPILKQGANLKFAPPATNFVARIRAGRVVPMLSDDAGFDLVLNGYGAFLAGYADYVGYPLADKENLVKVAKFFQLKAGLNDQDLKANYLKLRQEPHLLPCPGAGGR